MTNTLLVHCNNMTNFIRTTNELITQLQLDTKRIRHVCSRDIILVESCQKKQSSKILIESAWNLSVDYMLFQTVSNECRKIGILFRICGIAHKTTAKNRKRIFIVKSCAIGFQCSKKLAVRVYYNQRLILLNEYI